jgi:hypothetical protein
MNPRYLNRSIFHRLRSNQVKIVSQFNQDKFNPAKNSGSAIPFLFIFKRKKAQELKQAVTVISMRYWSTMGQIAMNVALKRTI